MPAKRRKARIYPRDGESQGVLDATNLTIIVRWCAENNGSFTLAKEGGRGRGKVGLSRWRAVLLDGANASDLGRAEGRIRFNEAHADISMIVARAARRLEDLGLTGVENLGEGPEVGKEVMEEKRQQLNRLRRMTVQEVLAEDAG
jgi:hypothetical protein